jgi:hypothetical protein
VVSTSGARAGGTVVRRPLTPSASPGWEGEERERLGFEPRERGVERHPPPFVTWHPLVTIVADLAPCVERSGAGASEGRTGSFPAMVMADWRPQELHPQSLAAWCPLFAAAVADLASCVERREG